MMIDRRDLLRFLAASPALARVGGGSVRAEPTPQPNSRPGPRERIGTRERILFFGDSITQSGGYVAHLETLLRLTFPKSSLEIHNHGISSETISGTSEPDHDPRRPWAHERFARDVADWHPTILVSCFGMNDGNYHPFEEDRYLKYQEGIQRLIERTKTEAGSPKLILCTPPPFDPYQRKNGDPAAIHYGYKYPAVTYDDTLRRYSDWLMTLRHEGHKVADLHTPINLHLYERRKKKVSFTLMPDAVHPDATGHAVMAIVLAKRIGLAGPRATVTLTKDLDTTKIENGSVDEFRKIDGGAEMALSLPATWRFGPEVDQESLKLEAVAAHFDAVRVTTQEKLQGSFELTFTSETGKVPTVRSVTAWQLSEGVDFLPDHSPESPFAKLGDQLSESVMKHRQAASAQWRSRAMKLPKDAEERGPQLEEIAQEAASAAELSRLAGKLVPGARLKIRRLSS